MSILLLYTIMIIVIIITIIIINNYADGKHVRVKWDERAFIYILEYAFIIDYLGLMRYACAVQVFFLLQSTTTLQE